MLKNKMVNVIKLIVLIIAEFALMILTAELVSKYGICSNSITGSLFYIVHLAIATLAGSKVLNWN